MVPVGVSCCGFTLQPAEEGTNTQKADGTARVLGHPDLEAA